jgi:hypothetical protein
MWRKIGSWRPLPATHKTTRINQYILTLRMAAAIFAETLDNFQYPKGLARKPKTRFIVTTSSQWQLRIAPNLNKYTPISVLDNMSLYNVQIKRGLLWNHVVGFAACVTRFVACVLCTRNEMAHIVYSLPWNNILSNFYTATCVIYLIGFYDVNA